MTPFPPLPCFLYESEGTDFTYPPEDTETIISSSSMRSSIFTSPTSSTNRDLLSSPNFSVIASSSSTSILFCFALLLRIAVSSFIVSFRSFFSSSNFSWVFFLGRCFFVFSVITGFSTTPNLLISYSNAWENGNDYMENCPG